MKVPFELIVEAVLDDAVATALDEALRAELPVCAACLSASLARRMVLEVLPVLHANYRHECALTLEQVQTLVRDAGRSAAYAHCY